MNYHPIILTPELSVEGRASSFERKLKIVPVKEVEKEINFHLPWPTLTNKERTTMDFLDYEFELFTSRRRHQESSGLMHRRGI